MCSLTFGGLPCLFASVKSVRTVFELLAPFYNGWTCHCMWPIRYRYLTMNLRTYETFCPQETYCSAYFNVELKEFLGGIRFGSDEEMENAVTIWLNELAAEEYDMRILKLVDRYDKYLNVGGNYVLK
ncbi:hypothetical protein AVEN_253065-1 [Araneus ventricosus]|uniref:Uncharacterized protein n=1 Tax=Araneus ventricosus TaxID=182803 RepID=A0A4Y2MG82_ARAVE|nr:hypothetical protein AVEN_253065-1 [Araneus ventricosus]